MRPPLRRLGVTLFAVAASVSGLAVLGLALSAGSSSPASSGTSFSLLQMNLCLSGRAGCYEPADHAAVLDEAAAQIEDHHPPAVTINEACRRDAAELARRTGYALSFAAVDYGGAPLPCIDPGERGLFGIAVLTQDDVRATQGGAFTVRADPEERRWLCATTENSVTVCTAHLSTRYSSGERIDNDVQCSQLRGVLARRASLGTTFFGGDLNRQDPCAPEGMWILRDTGASQSPGLQHVYGTTSAESLTASVAKATHTDHDFLFAAAPAG